MSERDKSKSLELAMREFEEFKKGKNMPVPVTERALPALAPQHADKMLYCATHQGLASQMILKLSPGKAEISEVRKLAHARVNARNEKVDESRDVLRTHALEPGQFRECPHCRSNSLVLCSVCETLSCIGPDENRHCCPCCGRIAGTRMAEIKIGIAQQPPQSALKARNAEQPQARLSHSRQSHAGQMQLPAPRNK